MKRVKEVTPDLCSLYNKHFDVDDRTTSSDEKAKRMMHDAIDAGHTYEAFDQYWNSEIEVVDGVGYSCLIGRGIEKESERSL